MRTNHSNARTEDRLTPRVSLTQAIDGNVSAHASQGQGFKSGGFDMRGEALFTPTTVLGYAPETIGSVEGGIKGNFLNNARYPGLAGFRSNSKDLKVTIQVPNVLGGGIARVAALPASSTMPANSSSGGSRPRPSRDRPAASPPISGSASTARRGP